LYYLDKELNPENPPRNDNMETISSINQSYSSGTGGNIENLRDDSTELVYLSSMITSATNFRSLYLKKIGFQGALRKSAISIVNIFSLYKLQNKNKQKDCGFLKKLGQIVSVVLTFIGYKQADKHPDKQSVYNI